MGFLHGGVGRLVRAILALMDVIPPEASEPARPRLRRAATADLSTDDVAVIRSLLVQAFGSDEDEAFTDEDWDHARGGVHYVLEVEDRIVAHASVVERVLHLADRPLRTGYVEAVAVRPDRQGQGFGSLVMADVTSDVRDRFELGALGTGRQPFYERLGWSTWTGPSFVRAPEGLRRTSDDDGFIMVLPTPSSPALDLTAAISCDWRPGDVW